MKCDMGEQKNYEEDEEDERERLTISSAITRGSAEPNSF